MEIAIDTLKIFERLKAANLNEQAAKEIAEVMRDLSLESQKGLATKEDLMQLKSDLRQLKTEIDGELKLIKWMLGILIAGVISLVLKAFFMP
jgi:hypothetical protein